MTITLIKTADATQRVTFTWSDDMGSCSFTALGEHDLDAILAADGHEGATVDGYATEIA